MNSAQLVMHGIAVKKYAQAKDIASLTGLSEVEVEATLSTLVSGGRAAEAGGKYLLTPIGQVALRGVYGKAYGALRSKPNFVSAYEHFERINNDLKQLITDWQTINVGGQVIANDHSAPDYDQKVIDRLGKLHDRVDAVLAELAKDEPRIGTYQTKLLTSLERAEDGEIEWVSDATIESYHTVWFELHEDLLRIMGRAREEH